MTRESIPNCLCGLESVAHTSSTSGRRYYRCPKDVMDPTSCSFLHWCKEAAIVDLSEKNNVAAPKQAPLHSDEHSPLTRRSVQDDGSVVQGKSKEFGSAICFQCGKSDHVAKNCPLMEEKHVETVTRAVQDGKNASSSGTCFYCHEEGHFVAECPKKSKDILARKTCFRCRQVGHWASQCREPRTKPAGQERQVENKQQDTGIPEGMVLVEEEPKGKKKSLPEKRKSTDAMEMPPPKNPSPFIIHHLRQRLPLNMDVKKLPLSMRGGGSYSRPIP